MIAPDLINKSLTAENVVPNMVLQGEVMTKEAKGFLVKFGLKDKAMGFIPSEESSQHLVIG